MTERDTHGELIVGAYRVRVSGSGVSAITHDINIFIIDSIIFIDIRIYYDIVRLRSYQLAVHERG